jgi:DNA-binding MarR family transcriptional regulator
VPHENDRRATLAEITDAGRETARRATEALNAAAFGIEALGNDEQEAITALLTALRVDAGDFADGA